MTKKPARIRVSLSRHLSASEGEMIRDMRRWQFKAKDGGKRTAHMRWQPHSKKYLFESQSFWARLSDTGQLYVESTENESRDLFLLVVAFLDNNFVNIHPTAVKTLRELA